MGKYIVMNNSSWRSKYGDPHYRHVAIVELEEGYDKYPAMISPRAKGIKKIIEERHVWVGKTPRSYGYQLLKKWEQIAKEHNEREGRG